MFLRSGGPNKYAADSYRYPGQRQRGGNSAIPNFLYWFVLAIVFMIALIIPQLIPESVAYNTAEGIGFTDVEVTDREWLFIQFTGCDKNDSVKFTVTGTNSAGETQTFFVCAGLFKGGTPRFR